MNLSLNQRENRMRHLMALLFVLVTSAAAADNTITYQGQLQDTDGPVNATVDMTFALFEQDLGGSPVGGPVSLSGVSVVDGLFQVNLDFGDQPYASGLWLAIDVEGEPLAPRQAITGAPFAVSAAPGSGSNWELSEPHIHYIDGRVGIGTSSPSVALDVVGSAKFGDSSNQAGGSKSFVGGGQNNEASGDRGFVGGGAGNVAAGLNSFVAGTASLAEGRGTHASGRMAHALHEGSFVWSHWNLTDPEFASTGVNQFLIRAEGGVGIGTNSPSAALDVVGAAKLGDATTEATGANSFAAGGSLGFANKAEGSRSFVGGGRANSASGLDSFVGGGRDNVASAAYSFAAGRRAKAQHTGTFVWANDAISDFSSTGEGQFLIRAEGGVGIGTSSPSAALDVIGSARFGDQSNQASGTISFVGGGFANTASALGSFVGGGRQNTASGANSFVAGGGNNFAGGDYSFAGGRNAKATANGSFIWADSLDHDFDLSTLENAFSVRATGGVGFFTSVGSDGSPDVGTYLIPGGSSWLSYSDRNKMMSISEVDPGKVLESLMQMPISEYSYKSQDESIRHMGPMAEDLHPLFGLGEDERMISAMNLSGIALAAIQGLNGEFDSAANRLSVLEIGKNELAERVAALEAENAELRQMVQRNSELEARLVALEALLGENHQAVKN